MRACRLIGFQFDLAWESALENEARVEAWMARRQPEAGSLVVLPEMFTTGFTMNPVAVGQPEGGPSEIRLAGWARQYGVWLVGGLAVRQGNRNTNQAVVWGPDGEILTRYRKQRPFTPGGESACYEPGTEPGMFAWGDLRVAPFICYDLRFPELFREATARWRPEVFVVIASWPDTRVAHWVTLLQARAIEGQAYVIGVNRTGTDPRFSYAGRSLVIDPLGAIVADGGSAEGAVEALLDVPALREYRTRLPFLDDQRFPQPVSRS
ncbi:MAG: nitrilase-related carbon-nitrogen hydrolase [Limisphaerales bacterium]